MRTATPVTNSRKWWCPAALSEYEARFLNGPHRSVNRKVQGSNPCSGAKSEYESWDPTSATEVHYISFISVLHQLACCFELKEGVLTLTRALLERDVSPNPYDDVPDELAKALEDYLLVSDEGELLEDPNRLDAVRLLFVQLDETYDGSPGCSMGAEARLLLGRSDPTFMFELRSPSPMRLGGEPNAW